MKHIETFTQFISEEADPKIGTGKKPKGSSRRLYTDENPKDTIQGLKFSTPDDAEDSVRKIKSSGRSHAHKIQAAIAMEQRAKAMNKAGAAAVYRSFINSMKEKTKDMKEDAPVNSVGTGAVAGIGIGVQGEPGINLKKKKNIASFISFTRRRQS